MARNKAARVVDINFDGLPDFVTADNFGSMLETSNVARLREGSVITGTVVAVENDVAVVDIGFKTEGRVPLKEFKATAEGAVPGSLDEVKIGDKVEVMLERIESSNGDAAISREKALREKSWVRFEKAHEDARTVDGVIFGRVKGGFTVDLGGAIAFLPGSQVDVRPVKDITPLMGISQPFQILKMDRKRGNIVVSRRAILEESRSAEREEMLSRISEGDVLEGVVKNITDYGAFIDLGAIDGLLHVTDISWRRISHPSEVLSIGDTVKVKVIKYDTKEKRISLGMKQLEESPWVGARSRYSVNSRHKGHVTNITDYGAFVELEPGIEGLVHVSEMSWVKKNIHPSKIVSVSQEVEVVILDIDTENRRVSLGMKQCEENPWQLFASKHAEGSVLTGVVKNIADFGVFVGFDEGVDGLVHVSDLVWEGSSEEELKKYRKGDSITVKVLAVEPEKERISLGIKQLSGDPLSGVLDDYKKGDVVTVTVTGTNSDGIEVSVSDNVTSFVKKADLSKDRVDQRPERFAVGDRVDAKIVTVDKASRKLGLSIKAMEIDLQKQAIATYGSADSGASLGDILGVALENAKEAASDKTEGKKSKKKADAEETAEAPKKASRKKKSDDAAE